MKKIIAIIFSGLFLGCGCNKEELPSRILDNGVVIEKPYIWWNKEEEHDQSIKTIGHFYNGSFLCESHQNGISYLSLTNAKNGKISWKWNGYRNSNDLSIDFPYSYDRYLYILSGSPRTYCLDFNSGKEIWSKTWDKAIFYKSSGYKDEVYVLQDHADGVDEYPGFYILDLNTGVVKDKIIPMYKFKNKNVINEFGSIRGVQRIDTLNEIYYLISYTESIDSKSSYPRISLYNYSNKKWIFEYKPLITIDPGAQGSLCVVNNKIYHSLGNSIVCHDLWSGDSLWSQEFKGGFLFGEYMIDNGTLYCAAEGDGYYALDAETGAIKWKGERAPGTSSRMVVLNGVLYYINGGDGRLWALDAATGKTLWRLKSPDGYSFKREINVMPGDGERKGYVLTSTWHGACAYEAER
ncbi:MAG: PQQ-binding-like beta-propeller repeat protein [Saprospiraceae bacterium]|jgi:outer membrane protein assembly factor BamB|nr:PQQ-binding-like beta-propeller repeat protein [Saprospiraceae bacterium]MBK7796101.1 PQQ-binding-like beta-propeller repeat protein [Saprospiraceae bacterium]MBL0261185.1 PQQ-binding-like beta-propeller repeat protein [Saprospiraceae bacterium]